MYEPEINEVFQEILGSRTTMREEDLRFTNVVRGIANTQQIPLPEISTDDMTFVFFTRPMMNLTNGNLYRERSMVKYMDQDTNDVNSYIRRLLDPLTDKSFKEKHTLLRSDSPFIHVFSNTLLSMSGWPDQVNESWISPDGQNKIKWGYSVGTNKVHREFDLDVKFHNLSEDVITRILDAWTTYQSSVSKGIFWPTNIAMMNRYIDYQTGIYVIVTNKNYKIKKIAKTIGHFIANPKGAFFDFDRTQYKTYKIPTINTRMKCFNAWYNDPILLLEFNRTVMAMNPSIRAMVKEGSKDMVEVPRNLRIPFMFDGVPFIDLKYNTLEWLVSKDQYAVLKKQEGENNE